MNILKRCFNSFSGRLKSSYRKLMRAFNTVYEHLYKEEGSIIINAWVEYRFGKLLHRNWGDELNVYMLENLTHSKVRVSSDIYQSNEDNYAVIGSIIEEVVNPKCIIWGSGAMYGNNYKLKCKPKKVCAVRGKKTREYLLSQGVECPEIYGDPALLLPLIYNREVPRKYEMGIIAHINDFKNPLYQRILLQNPEKVCVIDLKNYSEWTEIIDMIRSCEFILSSSLHGLIVSDAYKIPNIWLRSSVELAGGDFKFYDYFSGVNRQTNITPLVLTQSHDIASLRAIARDYKPIQYDNTQLLNSCPFKISW